MTTYRKTVLIYNPRAGRFGRSKASLLERVVKILEKNGHCLTVAPTTGPQTAGAIAREHIDHGADLIIAAGGDGTINEVAEGMLHSTVALGIIPGGTANVLAIELKFGASIEPVAERLEQCRPHRVSVGHMICADGRVSRHFLLMAGIGLDAHIVYHVNDSFKARVGKFAYWVAGWSLLGRDLAQIHVDADGQRYECSFALLSKVRNYGGDFEIARRVSLFDDHFEVVLFEGRTSVRYVKYFTGMVLRRLEEMKGVTVLRADHVTLSRAGSRRVHVQIDGEYVGLLPAEIRIVPDALTVLVPPEYVPAR